MVSDEIKNRLNKNPSVGLYELIQSDLLALGKEVSIKNPTDVKKAIRGLSPTAKREVKKDVDVYKKEYDRAISEFEKGTNSGIMKLPGKLLSTIAKGAGLGIGVASTVNTVAPGLFSTLGGYLVAKAPLLAQKLAIAGVSIFTPQGISSKIILGAGAIAGVAIYTAGKGISTIIKGIKNKEDNKVR